MKARGQGRRMRSAASSGTVLIVVLWVCLGLVSLTLVFGNTMLIAFRGTDNAVAGRQADQAIEGAVRYAQFLLANTEERGQLPLLENYVWERVPVGEAWFWYLSRSPSPDSSQEQVFGLLDEASQYARGAGRYVDLLLTSIKKAQVRVELERAEREELTGSGRHRHLLSAEVLYEHDVRFTLHRLVEDPASVWRQ